MNKGGQCMRGGAEALEGRDPGGSRRTQGNFPPNQTGSPSFFLFPFFTFLLPVSFFVSFFYFFLSLFWTGRGRSEGWYAVARWSGGDQGGYSREGDGGRTAERRWQN
jgi:hypothetical protein